MKHFEVGQRVVVTNPGPDYLPLKGMVGAVRDVTESYSGREFAHVALDQPWPNQMASISHDGCPLMHVSECEPADAKEPYSFESKPPEAV